LESYIKADRILGWRGRAGFTGVLPGYPNCPVKLDERGWRSTSNKSVTTLNEKSITLYGCSYGFGVGVGDEDTFVGRIQRRFPTNCVRGVALPGYGTVQALLNLQRDLRSSFRPDVAVICFLDVHTRRNIGSAQFLANIGSRYWGQQKTPISLPRISMSIAGDLRLSYVPIGELPLTTKEAGILQIDPYYSALITGKLLKTIKRECQKFGCKLIFAVLRKDAEPEVTRRLMYDAIGHGLEPYDISMPRSNTLLRLSQVDPHPNADGHKFYADKLSAIIETLI